MARGWGVEPYKDFLISIKDECSYDEMADRLQEEHGIITCGYQIREYFKSKGITKTKTAHSRDGRRRVLALK